MVAAVKPIKARRLQLPGKRDQVDAAEVQQAHEDVVRAFAGLNFLGLFRAAVVLEGITLNVSDTDHRHGLGLVPNVALLLMSDASVLAMRASPSSVDPRQFISLAVDGDGPGGFSTSCKANVLIAVI